MILTLDSLAPNPGSTKARKRKGRGIGCGTGKTCGRGHKGQHSRNGASHKAGFEGGQMPLQRRIPKSGFTSRKSLVRKTLYLSDLIKLSETDIDIKVLHKTRVIGHNTKYVKVISPVEISKAINLKGIPVTASVKAAIEGAGGSVTEES